MISLLRPSDMRFAKALEYIAGSKLFYVVVDSEQTSKLLLEKESFTQRETCIPNSKIAFRDLSPHVCYFQAKPGGRKSSESRRRAKGGCATR